MSQCERIYQHLVDHGSITALEAMNDYGVFRLASRISDLKKAGIPVVRDMVEGQNRFGEPTRYARYSLKGEQ